MDSESPPHKKMKQARLPFQILSPKGGITESKPPAPSRKRHLSEDSQEDDIVVVKMGKKSEDTKENETVVTPCTEVELDMKAPAPSTGDKSAAGDTIEDASVKESNVPTNVESKSELPNFLMNMKSNLADLLGKKVLDLSSDVGSCDCGCEDDDSAGSALEEYYEHCKKEKATPKSSEKKPRRKSGHKGGSKNSSPSKTKSPKGTKKVSGSPKSSESIPKPVTPEKVTEIPVSKPKSSPKNITAQKSSILSQKAIDMFAKWRKPSDSSQKNENSVEVKDKVHKNEKTMNGLSGKEMKKIEDVEKKVENSKKESSPPSIKHSPKKLKLSEASNSVKEKSGLKETVQAELSNKSEEDIIQLSDSSFEEITPKKGKKNESTTFTGILKKSDEAEGLETSMVTDDDVSFTLTPTGLSKTPQRRLTPKQIERQKEVAKKQEEKEKQRLERENEKKRLKLEKEEQRKKDKEEKEEQRRKEKEEKEKKKQAEQDLKNEEKKKKELQKAEEKRKKDEDKKKAEEEEERKKAKASALFTSFFVPKSTKTEQEDPSPPTEIVQNFMPFEVKPDMRVAPHVRHALSSSQKQCLDEVVSKDSSKSKDCLYLAVLRSGKAVPKTGSRTWPLEDNTCGDDISIIEADDDDAAALISDNKKVEKMRAKYLMFHENHRPAYRGTWRKKSTIISGRCPFKQEKIFDYEVDSADEWEEEEPGESLHGSDDENDKEPDDDYELDNSIFVPHGHLSDDERDAEENEEIFSPETQKAKLKLLGEEFEAQMKSKTSTLKPIIIVLTAALQASSCSARYQKLLERRAVWQEDEGPIVLTQIKSDNDNGDGLTHNTEPNPVTFSSGPGPKKKIISEEAIPALITLVHGNQNKRIFLTNEFSEFLKKSHSVDNSDENPAPSESSDFPRPSTPSTSGPNPLVQKWPGLSIASRISISNKIKELAVWGPCPEEGPFYGRQCWYVMEEVRTRYGVTDLKIPNALWHYTLKPKVHNYSSPSSAVVSNPISSADRRTLITNFTKVMTPEEKKREWENMKSPASTPSSSKPLGTKGSTGKITSFTQQASTPGSANAKSNSSTSKAAATPSSNQPQARKRVPLLVSVPRGQQITSSSQCSLLSKFEASASPKPAAVAAAAPSEASVSSQASTRTADSKMETDDCIVLD